VDLYAGKFAEGFVLFDQGDAAEEAASVTSKEDLDRLNAPWSYSVNGFVTRAESNTRLKLFSPAGIALSTSDAGRRPHGLSEHETVLSTGVIPTWDSDYRPEPFHPVLDGPIEYAIVPESDLNGAGLLYFARYVAIMNYAERIFLRRHLRRPFSTHLVRCLSTDRRRTHFFANADDTDSVLIHVRAATLPHGTFPPGPSLGPLYRTPFKLEMQFDLYRQSDGVLMATSLVRKSLTIPAHMKSLLTEARRVASE
jgi:probable biosynthetic protein (TIGR04098 family)